LGQTGALVDLVATGARIVEPDRRLMTGELYPPPLDGVSLRNVDPEPLVEGRKGFMVASAESLSYAVAHGVVGDPRAFKRPARVTVPRVLPTEDVLVVRKKAQKKGPAPRDFAPDKPPAPQPWSGATTLELHSGLPNGEIQDGAAKGKANKAGVAVVLGDLDEVRSLSDKLVGSQLPVRAVIAPYIPSQVVSALASEGVASFEVPSSSLTAIGKQKKLSLPKASTWGESVAATAGTSKVKLKWLAVDVEQKWTHAGRSTSAKA
jgi:aconitate hydratase